MTTETEEIANYKSVDELMHTKIVPSLFLLDDSQEYVTKKNLIIDGGSRCGVVIPLELIPAGLRERVQAKAKRLIVCGADDGGNSLNDNSHDRDNRENVFPAPSMSFECLARLIEPKKDGGTASVDRAYDAVSTGRVQIVDFLPDQRKKLTDKEKKMIRSDIQRKKMIPPAPGYTLISSEWHRAATVVLHDTKTKTSYMMGQDDDQYFGVQLAGRPNTVAEAFEDLTPADAKGRPGVLRQGEWFIVPIAGNDLPKPFGEIVEMILPKQSPESNNHHLKADEIRIRDNKIYARVISLEHDQHSSIQTNEADGWHQIVCNTAIRSVSVEGVD